MAVVVSSTPMQAKDDALTICAISLLAAMLANVVQEGLGHAATVLLTHTGSGVWKKKQVGFVQW